MKISRDFEPNSYKSRSFLGISLQKEKTIADELTLARLGPPRIPPSRALIMITHYSVAR